MKKRLNHVWTQSQKQAIAEGRKNGKTPNQIFKENFAEGMKHYHPNINIAKVSDGYRRFGYDVTGAYSAEEDKIILGCLDTPISEISMVLRRSPLDVSVRKNRLINKKVHKTNPQRIQTVATVATNSSFSREERTLEKYNRMLVSLSKNEYIGKYNEELCAKFKVSSIVVATILRLGYISDKLEWLVGPVTPDMKTHVRDSANYATMWYKIRAFLEGREDGSKLPLHIKSMLLSNLLVKKKRKSLVLVQGISMQIIYDKMVNYVGKSPFSIRMGSEIAKTEIAKTTPDPQISSTSSKKSVAPVADLNELLQQVKNITNKDLRARAELAVNEIESIAMDAERKIKLAMQTIERMMLADVELVR